MSAAGPGAGVVDLRSDTVTRPTPGMLAAMAAGVDVGDDVYGEDATANTLQDRVAALLGHEAGLFMPSGTMANQVALRLHARVGTEILAGSEAHILRAELGAAALLSGITMRTWRDGDGRIDAGAVADLVAPAASPYLVATAAIAVENTHNFGGGTVQPLDALRRVRDIADGHGLTMHLDGARLWNAHVASGVPLAQYGSLFETVSVCFSKGLGAPVGSMLVGSAAAIAEARPWRKRFGGGMRQIGVLAAAADYALTHHLADLADDHRHARVLAERIAAVADGITDPDRCETNIVVLDLGGTAWTAADLAVAALQRRVAVSVLGPRTVRLVTHRDLDRAAVLRAADVLTELFPQHAAAVLGQSARP